MAMQTPPGAVMNADDLTIVDGAEGLSQASDLNLEEAIAIVDTINTRASNRADGRMDLILKVEDWMLGFWEDDYGYEAETDYLLAKAVEDYSAKAWKLQGASHVTEKGLELDTSITQSVKMLDHGTAEYPKERGDTYLAKSGVVEIFALKD